jgi:hypothetical protein
MNPNAAADPHRVRRGDLAPFSSFVSPPRPAATVLDDEIGDPIEELDP